MIYFFGYGADRDADMMKAIVGRVPKGEKAVISGFELCIQSFNDVPFKARKIIAKSWDHSFKSYVIRPVLDMNSVVTGTMWTLTPLERKLIDNWEITGLWYDVFFFTKEAPDKMQMEIQIVQDQPIRHIANGKRYKTFLNSREKMLETANFLRLEYLKNN